MTTATISSKGWIVIPADLRRKYGLESGSQVMVVDYGGVLALIPSMPDPIAGSAGMLKGESSLVATLLRERFEELDREG